MKQTKLLLCVIAMTVMSVIAYGQDIKQVKIGNQIWMTENLNVEKFRNGDPIPQAKTIEEWLLAGQNKKPAWCYYDNDTSNGTKYGKLYNWYALNDPRGLAPVGWHIPSDVEWTQLIDFLGGYDVAGKKMKNTTGWKDNGNGTNESGFSGLPGGIRSNDGKFFSVGGIGHWWSSTVTETTIAWSRVLSDYNNVVIRGKKSTLEKGLSVRCIKD